MHARTHISRCGRWMEAADHTSLDFPADIDEMQLTKLTKLPSVLVAPHRVAEAAMHLECVVQHIHVVTDSATRAPSAHIVLAEVVMIHVSSAVTSVNHKGYTVCDNSKFVRTSHSVAVSNCDTLCMYQPVARLGGNLYCGTGQLYESWSKVLKA